MQLQIYRDGRLAKLAEIKKAYANATDEKARAELKEQLRAILRMSDANDARHGLLVDVHLIGKTRQSKDKR